MRDSTICIQKHCLPIPAVLGHAIQSIWFEIGSIFSKIVSQKWALDIMPSCLGLQFEGFDSPKDFFKWLYYTMINEIFMLDDANPLKLY